MDNNDRYQILLFVFSVAGCLGTGALFQSLPAPLSWLVILSPLLGFIYGEVQAQHVCKLPRIREGGEVTTNGLCKVGCPYLIVMILAIIMVPVFAKARQKARAKRHLPPLRQTLPSWTPYAAMALPVALTGTVALVGWGLHASEQRRRPSEHGQPAVSNPTRGVRRKRPHSRRR